MLCYFKLNYYETIVISGNYKYSTTIAKKDDANEDSQC